MFYVSLFGDYLISRNFIELLILAYFSLTIICVVIVVDGNTDVALT